MRAKVRKTYEEHKQRKAEDDRERAHRGGLRLEKEGREQSQPGQSRVGDGGGAVRLCTLPWTRDRRARRYGPVLRPRTVTTLLPSGSWLRRHGRRPRAPSSSRHPGSPQFLHSSSPSRTSGLRAFGSSVERYIWTHRKIRTAQRVSRTIGGRLKEERCG